MRKQKPFIISMNKADLFGLRVAPSRTSKALCLAAAGFAFVLGTVIGVLIPLYVLPPLYSASSASDAVAVRHQAPQPPTHNSIGQWTPKIHQRFDINRFREASTLLPAVENTLASTVKSLVEVQVNRADLLDNVRHSVGKHGPGSSTTEMSTSSAITPTTTTRSSKTSGNSDVHEVRSTISSTENPIVDDLTNGVFWSEAVESIVPAGFDEVEVTNWRRFCNRSAVVKLEEGCGRMRNRLVTFENGTRSCCRYRQNFDQIQGDIFSFLLSRLLGIRNLVPTALQLVRPRVRQWSAIKSELSLAQWAEDRPVILTQYMDHLEPAYIPASLQPSDRRLHPVDVQLMGMELVKDRAAIVELAQWSDLIVFDYITANLDRIVNNLYNMQWNPAMMASPTHNLDRDPNTGQLIFLDNESGLLHGYRLLDKYEPYHRAMLDALCIFRRSTVNKIREYVRRGDIGTVLRANFRRAHPQMHNYLPTLPERSVKILNQRLKSVLAIVDQCQSLYPSSGPNSR